MALGSTAARATDPETSAETPGRSSPVSASPRSNGLATRRACTRVKAASHAHGPPSSATLAGRKPCRRPPRCHLRPEKRSRLRDVHTTRSPTSMSSRASHIRVQPVSIVCDHQSDRHSAISAGHLSNQSSNNQCRSPDPQRSGAQRRTNFTTERTSEAIQYHSNITSVSQTGPLKTQIPHRARRVVPFLRYLSPVHHPLCGPYSRGHH
jgi:hypothetical protein